MSPPMVNRRSGFFASAARMADSLVSIIRCDSVIHSPPSRARGTIISRLPDSASVTAALRTAVHSSLVLGRISCVPSLVSIVLTASHTRSAFGSIIADISSLLSASGLNGGGSGPPHAAAPRAAARTNRRTGRMAAMLPELHQPGVAQPTTVERRTPAFARRMHASFGPETAEKYGVTL